MEPYPTLYALGFLPRNRVPLDRQLIMNSLTAVKQLGVFLAFNRQGNAMNISSAIIHALPRDVAVVKAGLAALSGVEVQAISPEGKIIVTIESADDSSNIATYQLIGQLDGVMSAAMVFHQTESEPDKEI